MTEITIQFYTDKQIANLLGVSSSWVRLQRFNRRHGKPHVLDVDLDRTRAISEPTLKNSCRV